MIIDVKKFIFQSCLSIKLSVMICFDISLLKRMKSSKRRTSKLKIQTIFSWLTDHLADMFYIEKDKKK